MASTNKTTNYELSQYIGTDKPTYLGDYNGDMLKIDTAIKNNADNITSAASDASSAVSTANTANGTANAAYTKSVENSQKIANFNLTNFDTISTFNKSASGTIRANSQINTAINGDGSLAKIYGQITIDGVTNATATPGDLTFSTDLRPADTITINGGVIGIAQTTTGSWITTYVKDFTIATDGTVTVKYDNSNVNNAVVRFIFINSLLFIKDFGDTPIPE